MIGSEGRSHTHCATQLEHPIVAHSVAMAPGQELSIMPELFMFLSIINKASFEVSVFVAAPAFLAMTTSFGETFWIRYTIAAWSKNDSCAWK